MLRERGGVALGHRAQEAAKRPFISIKRPISARMHPFVPIKLPFLPIKHSFLQSRPGAVQLSVAQKRGKLAPQAPFCTTGSGLNNKMHA